MMWRENHQQPPLKHLDEPAAPELQPGMLNAQTAANLPFHGHLLKNEHRPPEPLNTEQSVQLGQRITWPQSIACMGGNQLLLGLQNAALNYAMLSVC